jgi:hypothetical protein
MPFTGENAIMTVYGGRPPPGWHRMSKMSLGPRPLLQEVIRYTVKQCFYKIRKITYLKIFTCIIEMMYVTTFCWFGYPGFGRTDWTRN